MAKTIKFNLILDGKPVRTIEELQENFCIDDVLEFYQRGILQKWLSVRGFDEYLKKVEAIPEKKSVIIELIKIFEIEKSEKEIKEAVYSLEFWQERKLELEEWNKKDVKVKEIIADYHNGYDVLKAKILEKKEDMPFMKNAAKEIFDKYYEIFQIDFRNFFNDFKETSPLIIYAILMNKDLREMFLLESELKTFLANTYTINNLNTAKNLLYSKFETYSKKDVPEYNENNSIDDVQKKIKLHTFVGVTDGYWKDLEVEKTKIMVLSIPNGTFVRSANKPKEELSASDVNGNFLILDGLLYKSKNAQSPIVYMEV
ncbi:MAG TPA: hypothetical protein PK887_11110 [Ignavibacteriales bacterium]|nr:hypothetical protein [Ignavibacteriales bacterium]